MAPSPDRRPRAPRSVRLSSRMLAPLLSRLARRVGAPPGALEAVHGAAAREAHERGGAAAVAALAFREAWDAVRTLRRAAPPPLHGLGHDLRHGARQLARRPAFTLLAVVALGIGIGANTAIFSVVKGVLLDALPYPEAHRLVRVYSVWQGQPRGALSTGELMDYRTAPSLATMGAVGRGAVNLTAADGSEQLLAAFVTEGLLATVGVAAAEGRLFHPDEYAPGRDDAVLLTHGLWQRRFGGAPLAETEVVLDGVPHRVVGVLPRGFRLPGDLAGATPAELILPLPLEPADHAVRGSHFLAGYARLRPGAGPGEVREELAAIADRFVAAWANEYPEQMAFTSLLVPLQEDVVGRVRPLLLVLLGAVGLVLLMACANVAGLVLARSDERRREFAVRTALGAGRGRLTRQVLAESLLLAGLGGAAGVALALWALPALLGLQPPDVPRLQEVGVDAGTLLFAVAASLLTGLVFGLAPVVRLVGTEPAGQLRDGQRSGVGRSGHRARRALVVAETALALVLVAGAGLLLRSFGNLLAVDPGYETAGLLTTRVTVPASAYPGNEEVVAFYRTLTTALEALPGVAGAAGVTNLPLDGSLGDLGVNFERWWVPEGQDKPDADWQAVTPGYFEAMGMRIVEGRGLLPTDDRDAPGAVVFNQAAARSLIPGGEDVLGQRLMLGGGAGPGWVTVVGIVEDVRHAALDAPPRPEMYLPHAQFTFWGSNRTPSSMALVLRTAGDPVALVPAVRSTLRGLDPQVALGTFETMASKRAASVARPRFALTLVALFAGVALLLAAIGIYGVFAYSVRQRLREVAVRLALGARGSQVAGMVLGEAVVLAAVGVAAGLLGAVVLGRGLSSLLYGVAPTDPMTLVAAAATMMVVSVVATWIPAWRATRVSPARTLREDA